MLGGVDLNGRTVSQRLLSGFQACAVEQLFILGAFHVVAAHGQAGSGVGVGSAYVDVLLGDIHSRGNHILDHFQHILTGSAVVHGVQQYSFLALGESDAGDIDLADDAFGAAGLGVGVAAQTYGEAGGDIDAAVAGAQAFQLGLVLAFRAGAGAGAQAENDGNGQKNAK